MVDYANPQHQRYEPRAEDHAGDNNPYRGTENHGVAQTVDPVSVPGYDGTIPVEYDEEKAEPDPVPVRIVEGRTAREIKEWRVDLFTLNRVDAQRIANRMDNRTSLKIVNAGPNTAFVDRHNNTVGGIPLTTGGELSLDSTAEVWGRVANGETASLRILVEYTVEVP
jgi:hypothetical protein